MHVSETNPATKSNISDKHGMALEGGGAQPSLQARGHMPPVPPASATYVCTAIIIIAETTK